MNNTFTIYSLHESYKDIIRRLWLKQKRTAQVFYEGTRFPGSKRPLFPCSLLRSETIDLPCVSRWRSPSG